MWCGTSALSTSCRVPAAAICCLLVLLICSCIVCLSQGQALSNMRRLSALLLAPCFRCVALAPGQASSTFWQPVAALLLAFSLCCLTRSTYLIVRRVATE